MIEIQIFKYFRNQYYCDQEVLTPLRQLQEGSNSPKTPVRVIDNLARAVASRAILGTPRASLPVQRALLQTPDKVDPTYPVSNSDDESMKPETESIVSERPILSSELEAWRRKILSLDFSERLTVLEADLNDKTDI